MSKKSTLSDEIKIDGIKSTPRFQPHEIALQHHAARLWGEAYNSDPHAANKIYNEMRMGYALRSDVVADASKVLNARSETKRVKDFTDHI